MKIENIYINGILTKRINNTFTLNIYNSFNKLLRNILIDSFIKQKKFILVYNNYKYKLFISKEQEFLSIQEHLDINNNIIYSLNKPIILEE